MEVECSECHKSFSWEPTDDTPILRKKLSAENIETVIYAIKCTNEKCKEAIDVEIIDPK